MIAFSDEDKKSVFFYADEDAKYYDIVEELAQPNIDLIHDTMIDLVEFSISQKYPRYMEVDRLVTVLDVGSGTGAEAFRLLDRFPNIHIIAVDFSPSINREFERKFNKSYPDIDFVSKVTLLEEDFFGESCDPSSLKQNLLKNTGQNGFDAVVAGFFLHHYSGEQKQTFYKRVYECLNKGATLIHGDLFSFQSQALSKYAHEFGERWIRKQLSNPDVHLAEKHKKLGSDASRFCQTWIHHWNNTHDYNPAERPFANVSQNENHEQMIIDAGFIELGFPFRLWEAGILWALR